MDDPEHFHAFVLHDEKHLVGKTAREHAAGVPIQNGIMDRMFRHGAKGGVDFREELVTETGLTIFVPVERLGQIGFRLGPDDQRVAHFRRAVMRA